jgi:glycosyltransferase involved in cell wall biosynthesis
MKELTLPLPATGRNRIKIQGAIDHDAILKNGGRIVVLSIISGSKTIYKRYFFRGGDFFIENDFNFLVGSKDWIIKLSHDFCPSEIGRGNDHRRLSWRVKSVSFNDVTLIDATISEYCKDVVSIFDVTNISIIGYFQSSVGLGQGASAMEQSCKSVGIVSDKVDVSFQTRSGPLTPRKQEISPGVHIYHVNFDQINLAYDFVDSPSSNPNYSIGYWAWEQNRLPPSALSAFQNLDEIWVPSRFVQDSVSKSSPVPVVRIPHAIAPPSSFLRTRTDFNIPIDKIVSLVLYDFDSGHYRKNPEAAIKAFRLAASMSDLGFLVVKTKNAKYHPLNYRKLKNEVNGINNCIIIDADMKRSDLWDLMNACDIFLSLHRAEGFGLCIAEMMALGKVVLATGWSGNTDFMNQDNSCLINYELKPLAADNAFFNFQPDELWAEADYKHAAIYLHDLYKNQDFRNEKGALAKKDITTHLSHFSVGVMIKERLKYIGLWS